MSPETLLAFSTAKLRTDPSHARLAAIPVGREPVGLALVDNGERVMAANEFSDDLTVVGSAAALAGKPTVLGSIATGETPRDMSVEEDGTTLLVTNRGAQQLEAVNVARLP